jgi:hypothetical protein
MTDHLETLRDVLDLFADILAEVAQLATAIGTAVVAGLMHANALKAAWLSESRSA